MTSSPTIAEAVNRVADALEAPKLVAGQTVITITSEDASMILAAFRRRGEALEPFARIEPSSLFPNDGSEGDVYELFLTDDPCAPISGADLARARQALKDTPNG